MALHQEQPRLTVAEYLDLERKSEVRHDFLDGEMFAVSGASWRHGLLVGNLFAALHTYLEGGECFVQASDLRVRVPETTLFTYPDLVVVCGEPQFDDSHLDTLLNPVLVMEVLSDSTEAYDRGIKSAHFRTIPTLQDFVLVDQHRIHIERFSRRGEHWDFWESARPEDELELPSVGARTAFKQIYRRVLETPVSGWGA